MQIDIKIAIENLTNWGLEHGIKIIIIIVVAYFIKKILKISAEKTIRRLVPPEQFLSPEAEKKREDTLIRVVSGFSTIVIWTLAVTLIVQEFGIAIGPFLATIGVAGLAIGFGGQYLIRDVISGLFIIIENQYRIGDVVCFDKVCGLVEDITLRTTTLRDLDGKVHHVPHGEVKITSNLSKDFARVNFNINVSYNANLEKIIEIINKIGQNIAQDKKWIEFIIKPPQFLRIDDFAESAIVIKILGETKPLKQWEVTAEMRKQLKIAFDKEGIEIPFPQRVIHQSKQ